MIVSIIAGLAACFIAGILHGGQDAQLADLRIFEKRFGVAPLSFFGSESWRRKYPDKDPTRSEMVFFTPISDFKHVSSWASKALIIAGVFLIFAPLPYPELIAMLVAGVGGYISETAGASLTYTWLRKKPAQKII